MESDKKTYIVKEGDEVEGMEVTKIDVEKGEVRLWDKKKEKELILV